MTERGRVLFRRHAVDDHNTARKRMTEPAGMVAATTTTDITDHHHHRYHQVKNDYGCYGDCPGSGQLSWPRRANRKFVTVRKFGADGQNTTPPNGRTATPPNGKTSSPPDGKTSTPPDGKTFPLPDGKMTMPPNGKMTTSPFPVLSASVVPSNFKPPLPKSRTSFRYGLKFETCESVEWKAMSKQFARLPFISDNVDKFKNGYHQSNLPQNHHLRYYSDLHKMHQVEYANRNTPNRKSMPQQSCCQPWQWGPHGGLSFGTFKNSYYLSDPGMYAEHASNVIKEDSMITMDDADQLSASIWQRYLDNRQSEPVYGTKMTMWRQLSSLVKSRTTGCGLYMVGSTMNGFGGDVSDADFCLLTGCTASVADERHRLCGVERLQWLMGVLEHERVNGNRNVHAVDARIVYAKVPILRFRWTGGDNDENVDVDLCCNNVVGIRNTHLLYCYSRLDYRVRPLVLTIKLWASHHNINDPTRMTLSSYSLVLMVINFLQCVEPPILPSLQRIYGMKFSSETDIEFVHMHEQLPRSGWRSENKQTLGELLLQFFEHYNSFNYYNFAVSVRMGRMIPLERCRLAVSAKNDPGQWKFIGIEEPFERTNTARSVHNHHVFAQIQEVISKTRDTLRKTKSLNSIFQKF